MQINESMPFQSDPAKEYSIFIPSDYTEGDPIPAFLALHPLNTSRWNGQTWCEELADFAEFNGVMLICPDGGPDGKIDDAIDTAFTTFLLDSAFIWYDIDKTKLYATGFSWGGKTTYTYGLNHIEKFAGLMPIGAAITIGEINGIDANADDVPVYIVHGSLDSPNTRYYPLLSSMEDNGACVESNLLSGVGHTIDFANQVEILTEAYDYLKDNECVSTSVEEEDSNTNSILPYTLIKNGETIILDISSNSTWEVYTFDGQKVQSGNEREIVIQMTSGIYIIRSGQQSQVFSVF
jgi:predicted esterase